LGADVAVDAAGAVGGARGVASPMLVETTGRVAVGRGDAVGVAQEARRMERERKRER